MTTAYRRPTASTSVRKDGAAPLRRPFSGDTQPRSNCGSKKLLDQFREKMRALHYALATEKSYRPWIVEFLRFHRTGGEWRHPTEMGKAEIEAFLTYLAIDRHVAAKTQNQAFSALLSHSRGLLKWRSEHGARVWRPDRDIICGMCIGRTRQKRLN